MRAFVLDLDLAEFWWVGGGLKGAGCWLWIWRVNVRFMSPWKIMM